MRGSPSLGAFATKWRLIQKTLCFKNAGFVSSLSPSIDGSLFLNSYMKLALWAFATKADLKKLSMKVRPAGCGARSRSRLESCPGRWQRIVWLGWPYFEGAQASASVKDQCHD